MFDDFDPIYLFYFSIAGLVLALAEAAHLLLATSGTYRQQANKRLTMLDKAPDRSEAIAQLRRERGLSREDSRYALLAWLNKLIVQSGLTLGVWRIISLAATSGIVGSALAFLWRGPIHAAIALPLCGIVLPLLVLRHLRKKRQKLFTEQFAEAIDIIVRSLRAGHPVPAAVKMAAREMPDPIGSEFGLAEDEITYGLDMETAMRNMLVRVGQEDLPLFVASVAIQASSGGNLTEILENLSEVVRMRAKMRRKIKALSAEGRISALILSAVPIALFSILNWLSPDFYGAHWEHPWMMTGLVGAGTWMLIGNAVMHKMINFRF
jgi:tight adherence protein B